MNDCWKLIQMAASEPEDSELRKALISRIARPKKAKGQEYHQLLYLMRKTEAAKQRSEA